MYKRQVRIVNRGVCVNVLQKWVLFHSKLHRPTKVGKYVKNLPEINKEKPVLTFLIFKPNERTEEVSLAKSKRKPT